MIVADSESAHAVAAVVGAGVLLETFNVQETMAKSKVEDAQTSRERD